MESKIPFIDVGMGITKLENSLRGQIRRTMITPDNIEELNKIPIQEEEGDAEDIYQENIQLIELNALNAALAVIACYVGQSLVKFLVNLKVKKILRPFVHITLLIGVNLPL